MLGDSGRSFVVGFGNNYPLQPHHKAAACASSPAECTWSTFGDTSTNNPHQLNGALVGGPKYANDQFQDIRTDYIMNEVTLDYNAGFQSAVAGLKSRACGSNTGEPSQTQPTGVTSVTTTTASQTEASTSGSEQPTETNGECNSLTTITNSWEGNVQGKLQIVVPTDISSFEIKLETDIALTNINFYTAIATPSSGNVFSLKNYDWFSGLSAGDVLELDYQMSFSGQNHPNIVKLTLNEEDACSGSGPGTSTTSEGTTTSSSTTASQTTNEISTTSSSITESTTSSSTSCSTERYDYGEVLRLSNLFYEAQRSGDLPDNNRVPWRGDSSTDDKGNNGEDLSGGYHDGTYLFDYLTI